MECTHGTSHDRSKKKGAYSLTAHTTTPGLWLYETGAAGRESSARRQWRVTAAGAMRGLSLTAEALWLL